MSAPSAPRRLPPRVKEELLTNALRIQAAVSAAQLWERVLTEPERQRLGGDREVAYRRYGTAGMWMQLRGVSAGRAVVEVAQELGFLESRTARWLLQELGEERDDPEEARAVAVASGALVLVERPRAAYWQGQAIEVDWERRPALWEFFWELCRQAKAGKPIDAMDLGESAHQDAVAKQKSRLLGEPGFPPDLGACIRPVGRGTQQLHVPAQRIRLFMRALADTLREWTG